VIAQFAAWWFASTLIGLVAFPIAYRIFGRLSDRGYGLSRAFGLLVSGYALWMGASIGILRIDFSSVLGCVVVVAGLGIAAGMGRWSEIVQWMRKNLTVVLAMEAVFLLSFAIWSFVRANNPDITATEKPMELAFLNSILRSRSFPPADPWLSGFAISYYYFGYVLLALLTRLTSVSAGVAFNLGNALWFALVALGSYSVIFNLLRRRALKARLVLALLGPLFLLIAGNLEGSLEVLHARHVGWDQTPDGSMSSTFWTDLEIEQLENPPVNSEPSWRPERYLWWWRASRIVRDIDLSGQPIGIQPIDEFPFFSFLLADNHPHLLALPFALLAVGFCLQIFMSGRRDEVHLGRVEIQRDSLERGAIIALGLILLVVLIRLGSNIASGMDTLEAVGAAARLLLLTAGGLVLISILSLLQIGILPSSMTRLEFWVSAWLFGALAFLNTWDFPIYFLLLMAVLWWTSREAPIGRIIMRLGGTGIGIAVAAVLLYLPWYPTFGSQLGGIVPNVAFTTQVPHFLIMFGTLFLPLGVWMIRRVVRDWRQRDQIRLLVIGLGILGLLLVATALVSLLAYFILRRDPGLLMQALSGLGITDIPLLIREMLLRRLTGSGTALILGLLLAAGIVALLRGTKKANDPEDAAAGPNAWPFVVLLIAVGSFLILFPEFFYLRDFFNVRMNTVFKFYFAAWILWSLAAAYAAADLIPRGWAWIVSAGTLIVATPQVFYYYETQAASGRILMPVYVVLWVLWALGLGYYIYRNWPPKLGWLRALYALAVIPVFLGLLYSVQGVLTRTNDFDPYGGRTLDGIAHLQSWHPEEYEAILWISSNLEPGVILEAVGGSYTEFARISTHTGFPTVLGWVYHEVQWRGENHRLFIGTREDDVRRIYEARDPGEMLALIDLYDIDYVYVGPRERSTYEFLSENRMMEFLRPIYQNLAVTIYAVDDVELAQ
jgi:uncharacterized membrane protein